MDGLLPRFLVGLLAMAAGALVGMVVGGNRSTVVGMLVGGVLGFAGIVAVDALRGWRLMRWLRGSHEQPAPRDAGFWGEIGYRVERALRVLERNAEAERTRLSQFVAAMEASPNGVLLLDRGDQIEWCNSRAADHFGLDPQRDRRQRVTNLIRSPEFVAYLQAGDFDEPVTLHPLRGPGSLQVTIRRYDDDLKLVLSQDLTERERAEAMRRDFVANVSHEIRTPLTVLSGFLETLRNLPLSEAEQKRVIALMAQQAARMGDLVADLLTLARLEGSPRPGSDHWVEVGALFRHVEAEARALSAGRHVIVFATPAGAAIAGVESELRSAIGNLVSNAVRYTPDRRRDRRRVAGRRQRQRRSVGRRHRPRHRARPPLAPDRAVLPRRRQPIARIGWHRARPGDRQARDAAPWRRARHRQRAGQGLDLPPGLSCGACASGSSRRRRHPAPTAGRRASTTPSLTAS